MQHSVSFSVADYNLLGHSQYSRGSDIPQEFPHCCYRFVLCPFSTWTMMVLHDFSFFKQDLLPSLPIPILPIIYGNWSGKIIHNFLATVLLCEYWILEALFPHLSQQFHLLRLVSFLIFLKTSSLLKWSHLRIYNITTALFLHVFSSSVRQLFNIHSQYLISCLQLRW